MNIDQQVNYLMQGTEYGDKEIRRVMGAELKQRLTEAQNEKRPLKIYCGYDPTKADLHLGHTVTMRKLAQFQELGHEVTFLIGDYTALIGDPSDKDITRPILTAEEVRANGLTYAKQAFAGIIKLASNFTVQQFLSREKFKLRWERGDAIFLHETFYAVMQGYDAYNLKADVQVGGTDQFFNIVTAARKIMTALGEKPNIGICLEILPGTDGILKMSKTLGNDIPIDSNAEDMYGKLMSIPDSVMMSYFKLVSRMTPERIVRIEEDLKTGDLHPRDAKMQLAYDVTTTFYSGEDAQKAESAFVLRFQQHAIPADVQEYQIKNEKTLIEVMLNTGLVTSKSEGKRLIDQKGVRLDNELISDINAVVKPGILQVGKRRVIRIK